MRTKPIPSQAEADMTSPEEHFVWALRNLPMVAGSGMVVFSGFIRQWSKHLWECGFAHRDYLEGLADENGMIRVDQLPEQKIRFQEAFRGPHHTYNNAARWVKADEPDPKPVMIPNIRQLTIQEREALLYQFREMGMIPENRPKPAMASVFQEPERKPEDG